MEFGTMSRGNMRHSYRIRTVRLVRPTVSSLPPPGLRYGPNLGFAIRGGREHGTGFFISQVDIGSEAHSQGLRVGDQIVRINGFTVEDAIHKEILQLISNQMHLTLKVRSIGMIPVKEKSGDSISWHIISDNQASPQLDETNKIVRVHIHVPPKSKLGCWICKGPTWKQGIFIQYTAEGGTARNAGLRPRDQILSCNNIDFSDITFNEAVSVMKSSTKLELIVRKSAGWDLFPGESSGYNSSSSSVAGDQSLSWSDTKRILKLKEKSQDLDGRPTQFQITHQNTSTESKQPWDQPLHINTDFNHVHKQVINLSEHGSTITSTSSALPTPSDICKTESILKTSRTTPDSSDGDVAPVSEKPKTIRFSSDINVDNSTSRIQPEATNVSSAISQELLKIFEKRGAENKLPVEEDTSKKQNVVLDMNAKKLEQHNKLMTEFQAAHQKMFKLHSTEQPDNQEQSKVKETVTSTLNRNTMKSEVKKTSYQPKSTRAPPPPPPLPRNHFNESTIQINCKASSDKFRVPTSQNNILRFSTFHQPPPSPSPDYDTLVSGTNGIM